MSDFEKTVLQQISLLDDELRALNDRRKVVEAKIVALRMFLTASDVRGSMPNLPVAAPAGAGLPEASKVTVKDRVIDAALRILADGRPRHTSELLAEFEAKGIEVGGNNKLATVSSILSREGNSFKANRSRGWTLTKKESPAGNEAFDLQPTP
jgi:hypothetical protein